MIAEEKATCLVKRMNLGLKKISQDRERRKTLTLFIKPSISNKLKKIAEEEGIYLSDLVEHIFTVYLRYRENENNDCE